MLDDFMFSAGWDILWLIVLAAIITLMISALVSMMRADIDSLNKPAWVVFVLALPLVGPVAWFIYLRRSMPSKPGAI